RHHPYLHSFPTRRSSDLVPFLVASRDGKAFQCDPKYCRFGRARQRSVLGGGWMIHARFGDRPMTSMKMSTGDCFAWDARRAALGDRKSTRLNSSHLVISY